MKWLAIPVAAILGGVLVPEIAKRVYTGMNLAGVELVLLWPSSIMLMATERMGPAEAREVWLTSATINGALYAVVATIIVLVLSKRKSEV